MPGAAKRSPAVRKLATKAVGAARLRGTVYADARVIDNRVEDIETKNGRVGRLARAGDRGIGAHAVIPHAMATTATLVSGRTGCRPAPK